jgi:hypothetical protein
MYILDGSITAAYTPKTSGPLKLDVEVADPTGKFHCILLFIFIALSLFTWSLIKMSYSRFTHNS